MSATPYVANEAATGTTGSDGLAVFTFAVDIDTSNHAIVVDRFKQGNTLDYTVTGTRQITFIAPNIPVVGAKIWLFNGVQGVTVGLGGLGFETVASVVSDAAVELGLASADIADPFASTDPNILQLLRMLKGGGRDLVRYRTWTFLDREFTFQLAAGVQSYALPSDFRDMVDDSGWDRTTRYPVQGPLSPKDWQFLQAVPIASSVVYRMRMWQGKIYVSPTPGAGVVDTMALEYNSSSWIMPAGATSPNSDTPSAASDTVCFPPRLVVARLKRDFRRNKKQDSQSEEDDYQAALNDAANDDSQGRTIYIGGRRSGAWRKLDRWNLPDVIR